MPGLHKILSTNYDMFDGAFIENHDPSPTQTLNREAACNAAFAAKNLTPTSDTVAYGRCHQHLGFKKGMAIASLNINGLRSHLDEVQLLIGDLGIQILALNETKLDPEFPKELTFHFIFKSIFKVGIYSSIKLTLIQTNYLQSIVYTKIEKIVFIISDIFYRCIYLLSNL